MEASNGGAAVLDPAPQDVHASDENEAVETDNLGPPQLIVDAGGQLTFAVGGKRPTSAALKCTGGKIEVDGQFEKGQRVSVRIDAVVNFVGFRDGHDAKTGQVVSCERQQSARITGITLLEVDGD